MTAAQPDPARAHERPRADGPAWEPPPVGAHVYAGDMSQSAASLASLTGQITVGARAARALVSDLTRRPGPKTSLLVGASPDSPVLAAAVDALGVEDRLTVVAGDPDALRGQLATLGSAADRVQVVEAATAADPVDVVVAAEPLVGTAEEAREVLEDLAKLVAPGGVLVTAALAVPSVLSGATAELDRQGMLYGTGAELVLRHVPPLRVHRLQYTAPDPELAAGMTPVDRTSSVPVTRDMHIDSHGVAAAGLVAGLAALTRLARPKSKLWLVPAAATLPVAAFFRDPQRDVPDDTSLVLAASDGRVLSVERVHDDRFTTDGATAEYLRVAVFLSAWDVHVNRAPVAGQVVDHFREAGRYAAAMTEDAEHNAAAYTVLRTARGRVAVAQRTGMMARRIVQRIPVGALLARGERFGLIRFGSRTDVYLPADEAQPLVAPDDRVLGGVTPIARWR